MNEFFSNIDSNVDISRVNDCDIIEENINNGKSKNVYCNTFHSDDIFSLTNAVCSPDKNKTRGLFFVIDSQTVLKYIHDVAEFLHGVFAG